MIPLSSHTTPVSAIAAIIAICSISVRGDRVDHRGIESLYVDLPVIVLVASSFLMLKPSPQIHNTPLLKC